MADVNRTVGIIFQGQDGGANAAAATLSERIDALGLRGSKAADALAAVNAKTSELDGVASKSAVSVGGMSTALQALAASLVVKAFIDANVELEKFTKSMTATTGSADLAAKAYDYVRGVANRFGIEISATADSFAKFSAATKGTALEGDGARQIFEAFSGTMSRLGSSSADINGAFVQLAQGISKGKFELEDLKSIAERVPGFFDNFARSLSITTPELFKLISAGGVGAAEMAKFAAALNQGLAGATFDGYINSMARLRNAIDDVFVAIGEAGAFLVLTKVVQTLTVAISATTSNLVLLGEVLGAVAAKAANPLSFNFGEALSEAFTKAAKSTEAARDALFGTEKAGLSAAASVALIPATFNDARFEASRLTDEAKKTDAALKVLGLDPKKFDEDVTAVRSAFTRLVSDPAVSGDTILAGLKKTLSQLKDGSQVNEVIAQLAQRFTEGGVSANQYAEQIKLAQKRMVELGDSFGTSTKAAKEQEDQLKKNEAAAKKAEEETRKYQLELEKLASNERIKNIEATVSLKIANVEADAKRVIAAFDSINNTVTDTGKQIGDLFGLFKDQSLSFQQLSLIKRQIDTENKRRDDALQLQRKLTEAEIEKIQAQTKAIDKGDSLIKIDGAGLQPHLEAFMFEILRTIQIRVNQDGLKLLLGT